MIGQNTIGVKLNKLTSQLFNYLSHISVIRLPSFSGINCYFQLYYKTGFPKSDLQAFVAACTDDASSGIYRTESSSTLGNVMEKFCCCKK